MHAMQQKTKMRSTKIIFYPCLATLRLLLLLSGIDIGQAQRAPRVVNGIVGRSALLAVTVPRDHQVLEARWKFGSAGSVKARLGDSKGRVFEPYSLSLARFGPLTQRLDMHNESTLRIRDLTRGDGGAYEADAQLNDGNATIEEFQLSVYDPVPKPSITSNLQANTPHGCNVTLVCGIPNANYVNTSWVRLNPTENKNERIQVQNASDEKTLHLSINTYVSYKYFCVVSNPADQENASISVWCPTGPYPRSRTMVYIVPVIIGFLAVLFMISVFLWRRKKKKMKRKIEDDKETGFLADLGEKEKRHSSTRKPPDGVDEDDNRLEKDRGTQQNYVEQDPTYSVLQATKENTRV